MLKKFRGESTFTVAYFRRHFSDYKRSALSEVDTTPGTKDTFNFAIGSYSGFNVPFNYLQMVIAGWFMLLNDKNNLTTEILQLSS